MPINKVAGNRTGAERRGRGRKEGRNTKLCMNKRDLAVMLGR